VIIASHNLDELERVADRVGIIDRGQLQHVAEMGTRAPGTAARYRVVVAGDGAIVPAVFPEATAIDGRAGEYEIPRVDLGALNAGLRRIMDGGVQIVAVFPHESELESAFHEVVGGGR
jgi:ABC-type multidrug transport system ATPase subunit